MYILEVIAIGQTRPRGQPKKTASALTKQDDNTVSSGDSSTESSVDSDPFPIKKVGKKIPKKYTKKINPKKRGYLKQVILPKIT